VPVVNTIPRLQPPSPHLHEPFLKRAADPGEGTSGAHALGGFLAMRLVDQFAADRRPPAPEALAYQVRATRDFLCDLHSQEIETQHLLNLVHTAEHARHADAGRLLWAPVLAFAYWLESQLRLEEAMDVLDTALRLGSGDAPLEEQIATHLQRGRVLREVGRFEESREDYVRAGSLAHRAGDGRSERRSRVGRALIFQAVGNLPEAERMLRAVLEDARAAGDRVAEAHAKHDLANTLELMGRPEDGIPLAFNAYQLYEEPLQRFRALSDLGILFKDLGNHEAAQDAFMLVIEGEPPPEIRLTTVSELIEIAGLRGDRLAFERWRREAAVFGSGPGTQARRSVRAAGLPGPRQGTSPSGDRRGRGSPTQPARVPSGGGARRLGPPGGIHPAAEGAHAPSR
jgi:tetratricopeptide (TPR) repeat protein